MFVNKITQKSKDFPEVLLNIPDSPKELYILGNLKPLLKKPRLAIVGSRKVSPYGKHVTTKLAEEVARQGIVIVSGLAYGVDSLAHRGALDVGGQTIAVLPTSLDDIYPATHRELAKQIVDKGGALVTEYPPGTLPNRTHFLARNRIVSGLSEGVLITEAAMKSGTMHTANFALNQGKTVMVVPGNITSPLSEGTNNLIKAGALPITNLSDVLLGLNLAEQQQLEILASNAEEEAILALLKQGITDSAKLLDECQLSSPLFNQTLTMLEITGKIKPLGAGHWSLN